MLKKIHFKLTILYTIITGSIFLIITLLLLHVTESNLRSNHFISFQSDMRNIITNLNSSSIISSDWLASLENDYQYYIYIEDNESPLLLYNDKDINSRNQLISNLKDYYDLNYKQGSSHLLADARHDEFYYKDCNNVKTPSSYYACVAVLPKEQGLLSVYILMPLTSLENQIGRERLTFLFVFLLTLTLLYTFFFFMNRHLLRPIQENQQKQIQFVASASHELRTPLSVIMSSTALLSPEDTSQINRLSSIIMQEGHQMKRLIDDMLLLASSDSQQLQINNEDVELDTLLLTTVEAFEPLAAEKHISIKTILPKEPLPICHCDKDKIIQVLSILLQNALSYSSSGDKITVSVAYKKSMFSIAVSDNGIGISDEDKKRIFDRFYRSEHSRNTKEHFGLGLNIAYEIISKHNGTIRVDDSDGGGSKFTIELPE